jgi:O-antigen/teichoic acid export membrane protein
MGSGDVRGEVRRAARAGVLLVVAGGIAGVLNLLFNVVVARRGGAANYGAIGSLLTVVTVVGIVATGFQYGIARQAAVSTETATQLIRPALRSVAPWATGALLLAALAWPLSDFLRLPSLAPVLLISAVATASVFWAALSGLLVGLQRFRMIAVLGVGAALLRLGLGFLVGRGTGAVTITLVISLISIGASFLAALLFLILGAGSMKARSTGPRNAATHAGHGTAGLLGAVIAGALWAVWGLPVLFARHLLHPAAAGDFAATQLLAGGLIWGTAPLVTAFFPTIARFRARRAFVYGELATLVLTLAGAAVLTLVGPILFRRLYGSSFGVSRPVLGVLAISATAAACATFAAWSAMAGRSHTGRVLIALLTGLCAEVAWDLVGAHTPTSLAAAPAVSLLVGGVAFAATSRRRASPEPAPVIPFPDGPTLPTAALRGER